MTIIKPCTCGCITSTICTFIKCKYYRENSPCNIYIYIYIYTSYMHVRHTLMYSLD